MEFGKKKIIYITCFMAITWTFSIIYFQSKRIDRPVFFRHLIETTYSGSINLKYIKDKYDNTRISYVKFPEIDEVKDVQIYALDQDEFPNEDNYFKYNSININLNQVFSKYDSKRNVVSTSREPKLITKIIYVTDSGKEFTENIGRVYIDEVKNNSENKFLDQYSSAGNSEGRHDYHLGIKEDVNFVDYNSYFKKEITDAFNIEIEGMLLANDAPPITLKKYGFLISTWLKDTAYERRSFADFYSVKMDFIFENKKKQRDTLTVDIYSKGMIGGDMDVPKNQVEEVIKLRKARN